MVKIVELRARDARSLLPLFDQVQKLHVGARPDIFRGDAPPSEREDFLKQFVAKSGITALVALSGDNLALGYLIFEVQNRGTSAVKSAHRIGFLHQLAVDAAYRRKGIASDLIEEMKARLRALGIAKIQSEHFAFNRPSAALMKSVGMKPLRITVEGDL